MMTEVLLMVTMMVMRMTMMTMVGVTMMATICSGTMVVNLMKKMLEMKCESVTRMDKLL